MHYNPDNSVLAVGCHDNWIYLYKCSNYGKIGVLKGHSSFVTDFDWSLDSRFIRSVCGAYELLFFDAKTGKQMTSGPRDTVGTEWADHCCKLGWTVEGIYPPGCDGTHINTVSH